MQPSQMTIRCSNCGQAVPANVHNFVDASADPRQKEALLTGELNTAPCPYCGALNRITAPLMYHDPDKELLIVHVPQELNMNKDQQQQVIGDLMKLLPKESFKSYMFKPTEALTMQGMVNIILEKDGITPEVMAAQQARVDLAQKLIEADANQLMALVTENDSIIDLNFFQTMAVMAQRAAQGRRMDLVQRIEETQQALLQMSSFGQEFVAQQAAQEAAVEEVSGLVQSLGENATRADFLALARKFADDDNRLQALVGLIRPAFDPQFFQELTVEIGKAPVDQRAGLESLRDRLTELTQSIDEQARGEVGAAVALLQQMLESGPNLEQVIRQNLDAIDDTFMAVLTANIEEMHKRGDTHMSAHLEDVYNRVMAVIQENMQPELVFVNKLMTADDAQAKAMIQAEAPQYGAALLEIMDAVVMVLSDQGQAELVERLKTLRTMAAETLQA